MVNIMRDACDIALEDDKLSTTQSVEAYKQVLDELSSLLKRDNISIEDRKCFANKMIEVADKIGLKDTEGKTFKGKLLNTVGGVVLGALLIGASVLGVMYLDTKNNILLRQ